MELLEKQSRPGKASAVYNEPCVEWSILILCADRSEQINVNQQNGYSIALNEKK